MIPVVARTRFLPQLDDMVNADARGAIDDMLQRLRELGVVRTAVVGIQANGQLCRAKNDDGYKTHVMREAALRLGLFADSQNAIVHSFDPEQMAGKQHHTVELRSAVDFVVRPK